MAYYGKKSAAKKDKKSSLFLLAFRTRAGVPDRAQSSSPPARSLYGSPESRLVSLFFLAISEWARSWSTRHDNDRLGEVVFVGGCLARRERLRKPELVALALQLGGEKRGTILECDLQSACFLSSPVFVEFLSESLDEKRGIVPFDQGFLDSLFVKSTPRDLSVRLSKDSVKGAVENEQTPFHHEVDDADVVTTRSLGIESQSIDQLIELLPVGPRVLRSRIRAH